MKKRILLAVLVGAAGASAMAQSPVQLDPRFIGTEPTSTVSIAGSQTQGKKIVTDWFNFMEASDAASGGAISYTYYNNNVMFPDTNVVQSYGDGNGGVVLSPVGKHIVGEMFDPKSFYYTDILDKYNPYTVDSIAFGYRYAYNIPGSVDTLEFQAFYDDAVRKGNLVDANGNILETTAWVVYDRTTQKGANAKQEWRITLDETDTSWANYNIRGLKLPNPATIAADGLIAITYRFIPGYAYSPGDTITHTWDPAPDHKLNQFQPFMGTDNAKTEEDSYNHSLQVVSSNKYNDQSNWAAAFIPGDAWNNFSNYVYISFHISSPNVGINPIEASTTAVYPNPSMGSESVSIAYTLNSNTNVTIELYDLLGNKVQTVVNGALEAGEQIATVNASSLNAGIYVYSIKAGDQILTGKMSIVK